MDIGSGIVVYVMIWWVIFFMSLPFGVRVDEQVETGHATSAPSNPRLWLKAGVTTVIATVLWGVYALALETGLIVL